jgi:hypothetical protein
MIFDLADYLIPSFSFLKYKTEVLTSATVSYRDS